MGPALARKSVRCWWRREAVAEAAPSDSGSPCWWVSPAAAAVLWAGRWAAGVRDGGPGGESAGTRPGISELCTAKKKHELCCSYINQCKHTSMIFSGKLQ